MVSRRAVLGGAGVAVLGAGLTAVEVGWYGKALHAVGLRRSPDHHAPPSGVSVKSDSFVSTHMDADRIGWSIAIPTRSPAAVVVCLHGAFEDHRFAFADIHMQDVVAEAKAPLVVASVDGGSRSYWHQRTSGVDPQAMLLEEFLPLVDQEVGHRLPKVLLGWSMGGYGAVLIAEDHPSDFVGFCATSPGLWATYAEAKPAAFDGRADYDRNNVFSHLDRVTRLKARVDCGIWDPFADQARRLAAALDHPEGGFGPGYHDNAYWRSVAPAQIHSIANWLT